jgi:hypothetical protein
MKFEIKFEISEGTVNKFLRLLYIIVISADPLLDIFSRFGIL